MFSRVCFVKGSKRKIGGEVGGGVNWFDGFVTCAENN